MLQNLKQLILTWVKKTHKLKILTYWPYLYNIFRLALPENKELQTRLFYEAKL